MVKSGMVTRLCGKVGSRTMFGSLLVLLLMMISAPLKGFAQNAPNPRINVKVDDCWRQGKHVWLSIILNNYGSNDKTVEVYNEWHGKNTTSVYSTTNTEYGMALVIDNGFQNLDINNFQSVECPVGVPVKFYVIARNVPQSEPCIGRLKVAMDGYQTQFRNIPIRELPYNTNMDNIVCSYPFFQFKFVSCKRVGQNLEMSYAMTSVSTESKTLLWDTDKLAVYDDSGNKYGWNLSMAGMSNGELIIHPNTPVAGKLTIKNVPASVSNLHTILMPFILNHYGQRFGYEVRITGMGPVGMAQYANNNMGQPHTSAQQNTATTQQQNTSLAANSTNTAAASVKTIDRTIDMNIPATTIKRPKTFAVVIGNEKYTQVEQVPYAANDAKVFSEYCQKTLGLPASNVRVYENATFGTLISAVADIQRIVKAYNGDVDVIFYYAGHGIPNEESREAYLLPVDATGLQTEVCYPLSRLYKDLGEMGARSVVIFMDACFSGAKRGEGMLASARGVALKAKPSVPLGNTIVFSAASGEETAFPYNEKGHGMFTYYLLKKLRDTKGNCTFGELGEYIQTNVSQQSVVTNRKSQTPTVNPSSAMSDKWRTLKFK